MDKCLRNAIRTLNRMGIQTVGCCCGHGKYPMTIIIRNCLWFTELFSGIDIPRKKRFYVKDQEGYYYIPEVIEAMK
jgi:hypothetical protein